MADIDIRTGARSSSESAREMAEALRQPAARSVERARTWLEGTGPRRTRPLFGRLPLLHLVPQDVHSIADYTAAATCVSTSLYGKSASAKLAGATLGSTYAMASALTDYRLSLAKVIPIEVHQMMDHLFGLAQIAAPFLFGYFKRDRASAWTHIANGLTVIGLSLVTDYRAAKGIGGRVVTQRT